MLSIRWADLGLKVFSSRDVLVVVVIINDGVFIINEMDVSGVELDVMKARQ